MGVGVGGWEWEWGNGSGSEEDGVRDICKVGGVQRIWGPVPEHFQYPKHVWAPALFFRWGCGEGNGQGEHRKGSSEGEGNGDICQYVQVILCIYGIDSLTTHRHGNDLQVCCHFYLFAQFVPISCLEHTNWLK
jgi:hypothetical protein